MGVYFYALKQPAFLFYPASFLLQTALPTTFLGENWRPPVLAVVIMILN